jgi:hypothetical protein
LAATLAVAEQSEADPQTCERATTVLSGLRRWVDALRPETATDSASVASEISQR